MIDLGEREERSGAICSYKMIVIRNLDPGMELEVFNGPTVRLTISMSDLDLTSSGHGPDIETDFYTIYVTIRRHGAGDCGNVIVHKSDLELDTITETRHGLVSGDDRNEISP